VSGVFFNFVTGFLCLVQGCHKFRVLWFQRFLVILTNNIAALWYFCPVISQVSGTLSKDIAGFWYSCLMLLQICGTFVQCYHRSLSFVQWNHRFLVLLCNDFRGFWYSCPMLLQICGTFVQCYHRFRLLCPKISQVSGTFVQWFQRYLVTFVQWYYSFVVLLSNCITGFWYFCPIVSQFLVLLSNDITSFWYFCAMKP